MPAIISLVHRSPRAAPRQGTQLQKKDGTPLRRLSREMSMYALQLPELSFRPFSPTRSPGTVPLHLFIRFFAGEGRWTRRGLRHRPGRRRLRKGGRHPLGWGVGGSDLRLLGASLDAFRCRRRVQSTAYGAFNLLLTDRRGSEAHILSPSNDLSSTRPLKFDVPQIDVFFADINCLGRPGHIPFLLYLQNVLGRVDLIKPEIPEGVRR